jgi:NADH-quinone oxidoreductase subunit A
MTALAGYLLIFIVVAVGFVFIHLMIGRLVRPIKPDPEKLTIYECGEPTIGSAWIQFDLRFYVVALLFVIFDVEVAFFFPWAVVFGKANALALQSLPVEQRVALTEQLVPPYPERAADRAGFASLLRKESPEEWPGQRDQVIAASRETAGQLAWLSFWDIFVFFFVLLVGYAYLWKRGDLDWVRSMAAEAAPPPERPATAVPPEPAGLVGAGRGV